MKYVQEFLELIGESDVVYGELCTLHTGGWVARLKYYNNHRQIANCDIQTEEACREVLRLYKSGNAEEEGKGIVADWNKLGNAYKQYILAADRSQPQPPCYDIALWESGFVDGDNKSLHTTGKFNRLKRILFGVSL